jgi:iron complex transport system ATP-binding protein
VNALLLSQTIAAPWTSLQLGPLDLALAPGEVIGVIGPNGAGKSTLLRVACGDIAADSGTLELLGRPLNAWPPRQRARRLAVLPQQSLLTFPYTVTEVVTLGRVPHDSGRATDRRIVDNVLAALDLDHLRERRYTELSGGERQRVQLARVFAQVWEGDGPRLLLLDEPTSALDLAHQQQVLAGVRNLARDGCGVLMVLHDFNLLAAYADRLLVLQTGQCRALGTPDSVLSEQLFRDVFDVDVNILRHPTRGTPMVCSG